MRLSSTDRRWQYRRRSVATMKLFPFVTHDDRLHLTLVIPLLLFWLGDLQIRLEECFCTECDGVRFYQLLEDEYGEDFARDVERHHHRVRMQRLQDSES